MKSCITEKIEISNEQKMVAQDEPKIPAKTLTVGQSGDTFQKQQDFFMPDYSLIDTNDVKTAIEASDLGSFNSCPLLQVTKTIDGLAKILLV